MQLRKHIRKEHGVVVEDGIEEEDDTDDKKFKDANDLGEHIGKEHGIIECKICGWEGESMEELATHRK